MKKKVIYSLLIFISIVATVIFFSGKVEASTTYNSEIAYDENWDGTVTVVANGKYIESATIPSTINGKTVTKISRIYKL